MLGLLAFMQVLGIYAFFRGILPLSFATGWKILFGIIIEIGVTAIPVVLFYCSYFPKWLNLLYGYACLLLIYLAVVAVVFDIARICGYGKENLFAKIVMFMAVFAALVVWRSVWQPTVRNVRIFNAEMPQNYKIVQLTDLHTGPILQRAWLEGVVDKVNEINADIVVITGDSLDGYVKDGLPELEPLKKIKAPIYMVFGNHEYYYDADSWREAFENMGITVLRNNSVVLNDAFVLGGGDWGRGYLGKFQHHIADTFAQAPSGLPKILLSHFPKSFAEAKDENVFLQISGHTHGGQSYPINWATQLANDGYLRGLYSETTANGEKAYLYVSDGTGLWAGMPARFGSENEITVFTFTGENEEDEK